MNLDDVKNFLNQYETCVLATVDGTQPQAATVGYSVDDDFKILIATNVATRKAKNLISNSRVALVVGFEGTTTLQLEGSVRQLDTEESSDRLALHFEKVPGAKLGIDALALSDDV